MFPPPKHHLQERRTSAQDQEAGEARDQEVDHNSHPTNRRLRCSHHQSTTSRRGE